MIIRIRPRIRLRRGPVENTALTASELQSELLMRKSDSKKYSLTGMSNAEEDTATAIREIKKSEK
jgi:hypothetical protein